MRIRYSDVFQKSADGMVSPKVPVQIGGVTMGPGISFGSGVSFSGIDLAAYDGKDLEVDQLPNGVVVINGIYK